MTKRKAEKKTELDPIEQALKELNRTLRKKYGARKRVSCKYHSNGEEICSYELIVPNLPKVFAELAYTNDEYMLDCESQNAQDMYEAVQHLNKRLSKPVEQPTAPKRKIESDYIELKLMIPKDLMLQLMDFYDTHHPDAMFDVLRDGLQVLLEKEQQQPDRYFA